MIPKIGSIGKGLVTMGRRRSSKVIELYDEKHDFSDGLSEDAYIDTYRELLALAGNAPSWTYSSSNRPKCVERDDSSEESILSEAITFNESKANGIADRLQSFNGKKLHCSVNSETSRSTYTTSSSTFDQYSDVDDSLPSPDQQGKEKALSRPPSFNARNLSSGGIDRKNSIIKNSHTEKKSSKTRASETGTPTQNEGPPVLYTRDNPPPPPPRRNRRVSHLCPPPPPPPPGPLKTNFRARRKSSGEAISQRRKGKSFTESESAYFDKRRRRVSFQDEMPTGRPKGLSRSFNETSFSPKKEVRRSNRQSGVSAPRRTRRNRRVSIEVPTSTGPKPTGESFACNESLSASMPNVLSSSGYSNRPKATSFHDSDFTAARTSDRLRNLNSSSTELALSGADDTGTGGSVDSMLAIQDDRSNENGAFSASFREGNTMPTSVHTRERSTSFPNDNVMPISKSMSFCQESNAPSSIVPVSKSASFYEDNRAFSPSARPSLKSSFHEDSLTSISSKQTQAKSAERKENNAEKTEAKDKGAKDKSILNKIPLIQKVRVHQRGENAAQDKGKTTSSGPKYDKNGRCPKHPCIIVAKKRPFAKGWDLVRDSCPRCSMQSSAVAARVADEVCLGVDELLAPSNKKYDWQLSSSFTSTKSNESDEVRRIEGVDDFLATSKNLRSATSLSDAASRAISQSRGPDSQSKRNTSRGGSSRQLDYSDRSEMDYSNRSDRQLDSSANFDRSQQWDGNARIWSSRQLDYSARSEDYGTKLRQLDYSTRSESYTNQSPGTNVVSKMPYKTPWGESGWYSGEVDDCGVPNGQGRMRVKNGQQYSGQWTNGYSEQYMELSGRMKRGFGSNVAPWKENQVYGPPSGVPYSHPSRGVRT